MVSADAAQIPRRIIIPEKGYQVAILKRAHVAVMPLITTASEKLSYTKPGSDIHWEMSEEFGRYYPFQEIFAAFSVTFR